MAPLSPRFLLLTALAVLAGCSVFDPQLYRDAEGDLGFVTDGPLQGPLAEVCGMEAPLLDFPPGAQSFAFSIDTIGRVDDTRDVIGCTGEVQDGPDLFLAIDTQPDERWHFHIRVDEGAGDGDPAIYLLSDCDDRGCSDGDGLDVCEASSDEHFSFQAQRAERLVVSFDSPTDPAAGGGFSGSVEAYRVECGDGSQDHSEGCDDGNDVDDDLCGNDCRVNLTGTSVREDEVNDDPFGANRLRLEAGVTMAVRGAFERSCEVDFFIFDVPTGGGVLDADLAPQLGGACEGELAETVFELWNADAAGNPQLERTATVPAGETCPSFAATALAEGPHWLRVVNSLVEARPRSVEYAMSVTLAAP